MGRRMSRARQNEGEHLMNIYVFFYCRCWLAVAVLQQPNMNARTSTYLKIIIIISINGKVLNTSLHFYFFSPYLFLFFRGVFLFLSRTVSLSQPIFISLLNAYSWENTTTTTATNFWCSVCVCICIGSGASGPPDQTVDPHSLYYISHCVFARRGAVIVVVLPTLLFHLSFALLSSFFFGATERRASSSSSLCDVACAVVIIATMRYVLATQADGRRRVRRRVTATATMSTMRERWEFGREIMRDGEGSSGRAYAGTR